MSRTRGPHDFLLHLRNRAPHLARRLDGVSGLALSAGAVVVRAPEASWSYRELGRCRPALEEAAERFFGPGTRVVLEGTAADEVLPFPVLSTKVWNHVAFWGWGQARSAVLALPKPLYLEGRADGTPALVSSHPEARTFRYEAPVGLSGAQAAAWALPDLLDALCALAREKGSYAQLVGVFPGDPEADLLEARLYAAKEWGTPATPGPILQKYVGRLHYASEGLPGLRAARELAEAG